MGWILRLVLWKILLHFMKPPRRPHQQPRSPTSKGSMNFPCPMNLNGIEKEVRRPLRYTTNLWYFSNEGGWFASGFQRLFLGDHNSDLIIWVEAFKWIFRTSFPTWWGRRPFEVCNKMCSLVIIIPLSRRAFAVILPSWSPWLDHYLVWRDTTLVKRLDPGGATHVFHFRSPIERCNKSSLAEKWGKYHSP